MNNIQKTKHFKRLHYIKKVIAMTSAILLLFSSMPNISLFGNTTTYALSIPTSDTGFEWYDHVKVLRWQTCSADESSDTAYALFADGTLYIYGNGAVEDLPLGPDVTISSIYMEDGITSITDNSFADTDVSQIRFSKSLTALPANVFANCKELAGSLVLPETITDIGAGAFKGCETLQDITIPDQVTEITEECFADCISLEAITLPDHVTEIKEKAFKGCSSMEQITLPNKITKIQQEAFMGCTSLNNIQLPEVLDYLGNRTFSACSSLQQITLPNALGYLGIEAFSGSGITDISVPEETKTLQKGMFKDCKNLQSVTLPDSLRIIESEGFSGCSSLTDVDMKNNIKTFGNKVFAECTSLESIYMPDSITNIGDDTFGGCSKLKQVYISNQLRRLPYQTFMNCEQLTDISIPDSVTELGEEAFLKSGLTKVSIPDSVTKVGTKAFYQCEQLSSITFSKGMDEIPVSCFEECNNITNVTIPSGIKTISSNAFAECNGLTSVILEEGVETIDYHAFYYCNGLEEVTIPDSLVNFTIDSFERTPWISDYRPGGSTWIKGDTLIYMSSTDSTVTIPEGVKKIATNAIAYDYSIKKIIIPEGVTQIGRNFENFYGLTDIEFPSTLTDIDGMIARNTPWLNQQLAANDYVIVNDILVTVASRATNGVIPEGVVKIADAAFNDNIGIHKLTLPSTLTEIGDFAFGSMPLDSITIPANVTYVGHKITMMGIESVTVEGKDTYVEPDAFIYTRWNSMVGDTKEHQFGQTMAGYGEYTDQLIIPDGVTSIDHVIDENHTQVKEVSIPDSVIHIDDTVFRNTEDIIITGTKGSYAEQYAAEHNLFFAPKTDTIDFAANGAVHQYGSMKDGVSFILFEDGLLYVYGNGAMEDCARYAYDKEMVTMIVMDDGVSAPGSQSFTNMPKLRLVCLPHSVNTISDDAFDSLPHEFIINGDNESMASVFANKMGCYYVNQEEGFDFDAHTGILATGSCGDDMYYVFYENGDLFVYGNGTMVTDGYGMDYMGNFTVFDAFFKQLEDPSKAFFVDDVFLDNSVTNIGNYAFSECGMKSVRLSPNLKVIEEGGFYTCMSLNQDIVLPEGVESIGKHCFGRTAITSIQLNDKITEIPEGSLRYTFMENVVIPDNVTKIGDNAFAASGYLKTVSLPDTLTSLGYGVFALCFSLEDIVIPASVTSIGQICFLACDEMKTLTSYAAIDTLEKDMFGRDVFGGCTGLTLIRAPKESAFEQYAMQQGIPFEAVAGMEPAIKYGDVNLDGDVSLEDAQLVLKAALKIIELKDNALKAADYNKDDSVDLEDAQLVLKRALKIIS